MILVTAFLVTALLVTASANVEMNQSFLADLLLHPDFFSTSYHVIHCSKTSIIHISKMLAQGFQRYAYLQTADDPFSNLKEEITTFIVDFECPELFVILRKAETLNLFKKPFRWLLINNGLEEKGNSLKVKSTATNEYNIWEFLETLPLLIDSNFKVISKHNNETQVLISPYKISIERDLIKEFLAKWTPENGLEIFYSRPESVRRSNLQGLVLPVSLVLNEPGSINHLEDMQDKQLDTTTKVTYDYLHHVEFLFNITLEKKIANEYGTPAANGSFSGMVGAIQSGEAELGGSPLFFRESRFHILDYYASASSQRTKFIFISPPLSHASNMFAMPFDTIVWLSCLTLVIFSCVSMFIALNAENFSINQSNVEKMKRFQENKPKITFGEIIMFNIGAICLQGAAAQTQKPAGRIITLFIYLAYMFLYISYSASIVAILQSTDTSIQSIGNLAKSPLKVGADNVSYSQYYFKLLSNEGDRKKLYDKKIKSNINHSFFLPPEEGIKLVRQGLYAFHTETSIGYGIIQRTFTEEEKCGLQELRKSYMNFGEPWLAIKRNSSYTEIFRVGIKKVAETGFRYRASKRFYTSKPSCGSKSSRFVSVGLVDSYFAFLSLSFGVVAAFFILLLESIYKKYSKKFQIKKKKQKYSSEAYFIN